MQKQERLDRTTASATSERGCKKNEKWKIKVRTVLHDDDDDSSDAELPVQQTQATPPRHAKTKSLMSTQVSREGSSSFCESVVDEGSVLFQSLLGRFGGVSGTEGGGGGGGVRDGIFRVDMDKNGRHGYQSQQQASGNDTSDADNEFSTNERLLCTAFVSFLSFALLQMVFAIIAGSSAMVGDSAAMIVDSMTYLFNWIAEWRKHQLDDLVQRREQQQHALQQQQQELGNARLFNRERYRRKLELQMEIIPPAVSITALVIVLCFVLRRAIRILVLDLHRSRAQQSNPSLRLMILFSTLNLFLDGLNVFCFARAKHLLGYDVIEYDLVDENDDDDDDDDNNESDSESHSDSESVEDPPSPPPPPPRGRTKLEPTATDKTSTAMRQHQLRPQLNNSSNRAYDRQAVNAGNRNGDDENDDHGLELSEQRHHHHQQQQQQQQQQQHPKQQSYFCDEAKRQRLSGHHHQENGGASSTVSSSTSSSTNGRSPVVLLADGEEDVEDGRQQLHGGGGGSRSSGGGGNGTQEVHHRHANLNMCSAYTHVFADTLRSFAVILAALVAQFMPVVTPEEADATAAVIVSLLIFLSLFPLLQGLARSLWELHSIQAEERAEAAFRGTMSR